MSYTRIQQDDSTLDQPLLYNTDSVHGSNDELTNDPPKPKALLYLADFRRQNLVLLASVVVGLCTLVNIGLLAFWQNFTIPRKMNALFNSEYGHLEVANSYIKLDTAIYDIPRTPPKPITNFPLVVSRINSQEPRKVYKDTNNWMSQLGLVYTEENVVSATHESSTIMQFRALDYGMEKCTLVLSMPTFANLSGLDQPKIPYSPGSKIDVWKLDARHRLDPNAVSWSTRPARSDLLTTFTINDSTNAATYQTQEFFCRSGTLHTFEIACSKESSEDCQLEFTQDVRTHGVLAFVIKQEASV